MPTETLAPFAIISSTNLTGAVADIRDAIETFTPLDIPNLITWLATLEAGDTTLDGSNRVSPWIDRETGATPGDWSHGTADVRPLRATGAEIVFDGMNDSLTSGVVFSTAFTSLSAWGVFCVVKIHSNDTDAANAWNDNSIIREVNANWGLHINNTTAPYDLIGYAYDGAEKRAVVTGNAADVWLVIEFWHDGSNINLSVNGGTVAQVAAGAVGSGTSTMELSAVAHMSMRDLVLVNGVPSSDDRAAYLAWATAAYSL